MDRKKIIELLSDKKVQDYSYTIVFFVVFSFFVYFAIRPNLITAFNLQRELQEVKLQNREYEAQIIKIVNYQTTLEQYRDKFYLLEEAIPNTPQVSRLLDQVRQTASDSGMIITSVSAEKIKYQLNDENKLTKFKINLTTDSDISQVQLLIDALIQQRRIKTIDSLKISSDTDGAEGRFEVTFDIEGFYL